MSDEHTTLRGAAAVRMQELLPELLRAVRWRRRRRRAARGVVVVVAGVLLLTFLIKPLARSAPEDAPNAAPAWTVVDTDATVLSRCEVRTVDRAQWYVDDSGLQLCLREASRPAGLVRLAGKVLVDPAAIDALPEP